MLPGRHQLVLVRLFSTPTPGVPLSLKRTMAYADFIYGSGPRHTKYPVVLAVGLASDLELTRKLETVQPRRTVAQLLAEVVFKDQCQLRRRRAEGLEADGAELPCPIRDDQW